MKLRYLIAPTLLLVLLIAWYYQRPNAPQMQPENTPLAPVQRQPENAHLAPLSSSEVAPPIVQAARSQIGKTLRYDPAYTALSYPMVDVPLEKGV